MSGWRTALRIARREAGRAKGRSALVVAMIVLPVAALSFGDGIGAGRAPLAVRRPGAPGPGPVGRVPDGPHPPRSAGQPTAERLLALLPPGTRAVPDTRTGLTVHTPAGIGSVDAGVLDHADPLARGIFRQVSGRAPATADEVALTRGASSRVGADVGGEVRAADGRALRVVGIVEDPARVDATTIVLRTGAAASPPDRQRVTWLVDTQHR